MSLKNNFSLSPPVITCQALQKTVDASASIESKWRQLGCSIWNKYLGRWYCENNEAWPCILKHKNINHWGFARKGMAATNTMKDVKKAFSQIKEGWNGVIGWIQTYSSFSQTALSTLFPWSWTRHRTVQLCRTPCTYLFER